jgi:flagellar hook-associated protein 3 FlgL
MRVTENSIRESWLRSLNTTQSQLARTQNQVATGQRFTRPAEDPVGAVQVLDISRALSENGQYARNADLASNRLGVEETALASVGNVLQRLHELAVEANNATQTNETRKGIASEVRQALDSLVQLANSKDGTGSYLFSGFSTQVQPFTLNGGAVTYNGDQGQRQLQIGPSRKVVDGDNGAAVFQAIPSGNGVFSVASAAGNTGTAVVGQRTVTDATLYDGGTYTISFPTAATYEVRDAGNVLVASGAFTTGTPVTPSIAFRGIQLEIAGQPAVGDTFQVTPSSSQDIFTTVQDFLTALDSGVTSAAGLAQYNNRVGGVLTNLDQAITSMLDVRAEVGSRLNAIDAQKDINADVDLHNKSLLSQLRDLDYADALSRLNIQLTSLAATEKAFAATQGLSLFNYL